MNEPPVFVETNPPAGETLVLDAEQVNVWVIVRDDDGPDRLEYRWTIDGLWEQGTVEPIVTENTYGSRLVLEPDPVFDGRTLRCRVYDAEGGSAEVQWTIEVPEAAR